MIKRITIKNFRSLKDVTVDLQDVNLFIGPNNSGKSNFFKALEFLSDFRMGLLEIERFEFPNYIYNKIEPNLFDKKLPPMSMFLEILNGEDLYVYGLELYGLERRTNQFQFKEFWGLAKSNYSGSIKTTNIESLIENCTSFKIKFNKISLALIKNQVAYPMLFHKQAKPLGENADCFSISYNNNELYVFEDQFGPIGFDASDFYTESGLFEDSVIDILDDLPVYAPDPSALKLPYILTLRKARYDNVLNYDVDNFVGFLERMRDDYPEVPKKIEDSFRQYFPDTDRIVLSIQTPKSSSNQENTEKNDYISKKFGLLNNNGITFWSDELSDGILYFLALLAIIHQPDPPKFIMLEEPEKGIHPRRIHEVIDYIFQLAESKGIQVILSSHSTYVVDEFKDIPEAVFVFDKEGAETKIKNLQKDIIEPSNAESEKAGLPKINYTASLGDHWAVGFIGGVPQ